MPEWLEWTLILAGIVVTLAVYGWLGWFGRRLLRAMDWRRPVNTGFSRIWNSTVWWYLPTAPVTA